MRTVTSTTFHRTIGEILWSVSDGKETVVITDHKREVVVMLPVAEYAALMEDRQTAEFYRRMERPD